jgi:trehalose-phosphatase
MTTKQSTSDRDNGTARTLRFDDAVELAQSVAAAPRPILIGLDLDGVLSPLVDHADDARLLDGVAEAIEQLDTKDVAVSVVSGRALTSMRTFGLPSHVHLIGSHGIEVANTPMLPLTDEEHTRLSTLRMLAQEAAAMAGPGAWVETKFASVAIHVRTANPDTSHRALANLKQQTTAVDGASCKPGSNVLELFARHTSKGAAVVQLRQTINANTVVFIGDDVTDEEAFAVLRGNDISIKVGTAPTIAQHRLSDPHAVLRWLTALASGF